MRLRNSSFEMALWYASAGSTISFDTRSNRESFSGYYAFALRPIWMKLGICCSLPSRIFAAECIAANENLQRRDASATLLLAQGLRDDALQAFRETATDLGLFVGGELIDQSVHRHVRAVGVQRAENQMSCLGGFEGDADGFDIAHFADEHDIGIFAQGGPQRALEAVRVGMNFALVDEAFLVRVHELDRVFNRNDVVGALLVDEIYQRREALSIAAAGSDR